MIDLADKVAVVTGGGSGIGRALSLLFAREGADVVVADVDEAGMAETVAGVVRAGRRGLAVRADVSRLTDVHALAERAFGELGAVHVLCNNAGVTRPGLPWELTLDEWEWLLGVNLRGVVHGIRAFVPGMVERGEPAHVVNTASVGGLLAFPGLTAYTASKFAVVGLSEGLAHDLRTAGAPIGVSVLCRGPTDTLLREHSAHLHPEGAREPAGYADVGRMPPAEVAAQVLDAIRHDRFWILTHPAYLEAIERRQRALAAGTVVAPAIV
jgi:NAD(P)-dependent dehydrogenase (short-subunit alcohol dehydrogenase family)